ncbi:DNA-binding NarL/FixJ family response regulator [Micromonospora kangleipakensis]|uniref:DNA-binding NarL/FixJ family response regulator n=1 Tax=Micromonospora kangleipakensis TaxID=1077942 RepID=A0A4Q8BHY7_9ACTN|nr:response regulator transcription factor [Micromonospora kangleipakensis]RZU76889.1 DNA-binding NarL/FixJ family response regulator [Micromonospora kangleipakensis]
MRVVVADDVMIVRAGLARLLAEAGMQVCGEAADAAELLRLVALTGPDVAVVDIRMPPTHRDEGLVAAREIRARHPATAVLVLSQYVAPRYASRLLADQPAGLGYLLKERVSDVAVLADAVQRVAAGGCVVDPAIVQRLLDAARPPSVAAGLTAREREVLALMAEGCSNAAIAMRLRIRERTVESVCAQIFAKLGLPPDPDVNRRVLAAIRVLRS